MPEQSGGFLMEPARFPGRAPIEAYGNGGFRFADMSHRGSILALPSGIEAWAVGSAAEITPASLERVIDEAPAIEILLVGTGEMMVPEEALGALAHERIAFSVEGPATYEHYAPTVRTPAAPAV